MCTFKDDRTVMVCDVAIRKVQETLSAAYSKQVSFTLVEGEGTLVKAAAPVDRDEFLRLAREAIASVQEDAEGS